MLAGVILGRRYGTIEGWDLDDGRASVVGTVSIYLHLRDSLDHLE